VEDQRSAPKWQETKDSSMLVSKMETSVGLVTPMANTDRKMTRNATKTAFITETSNVVLDGETVFGELMEAQMKRKLVSVKCKMVSVLKRTVEIKMMVSKN